MSLYLNDKYDIDSTDWLMSNYANYKKGNYEKRMVLKYNQFKATYDGNPRGFGTKKEMNEFLYNINNLLNDFLFFFKSDTADCIEYATHISDITKSLLLDFEIKLLEKWEILQYVKLVEEWAILQYIKLRQHYFLKLKVAYEDCIKTDIAKTFDFSADEDVPDYSIDCYSESIMWKVLRRYYVILTEDDSEKEDRKYLLTYGNRFDFLSNNLHLFESYFAPESIDAFEYLESTGLKDSHKTMMSITKKTGLPVEIGDSSDYDFNRLISLKVVEKVSLKLQQIIWSLLTTYVPYSESNIFNLDVFEGKQRLTINKGKNNYEAYIVKGIETPINLSLSTVVRDGNLYILLLEDLDALE